MTTIYVIRDEESKYNGMHFIKVKQSREGWCLGEVQIPHNTYGFRNKEIEVSEDCLWIYAEFEEES